MQGSYFSLDDKIAEDSQCATYQCKTVQGSGTATVYPLLPGMEATLLAFSAPSFRQTIQGHGDVWEINYCHKGRGEYRMQDGCLQYLGEGDLFLSTLCNHNDTIELPLGYYQGLVLVIDPASATDIGQWLPGTGIDLGKTQKRILTEDACLMVAGNEYIERLFGDIFTMPPATRSDYLRLKTLELLLYLHCFEPAAQKPKELYEKKQVALIKEIHQLMTSRLDYRFTIEELAKEFCISPTALKANFKGVYGMSIAAYMKEYRMGEAAVLLRQTQRSVAEIAGEMGYESQSKFGAAFKEVFKVTPMDYRKSHT